MAATSPVEIFSIDLSPGIGRHKSWKVSVTASRAPSGDDNLTDWRSVIISKHKADKELEARRKAKPEPLIPSCSVTGFVDAALAGDETSGSSNLEVFRTSDFDEHVSPRLARRALLTQDSLDERRRKLSDAADESQGLSLAFEPAEIQLIGATINLAASPEDKPLNFEALQESEVMAVYQAQPSAQACSSCNNNKETQPRDEASCSKALQLQKAAISSSPPQLPKPSPCSSSSSSCSSIEPLRQTPAATYTHMPVNTVDRLLNGGRSATETGSRRKSKTPPLPRTKSTRSRHTKQAASALRQPLLSRTHSAHTPDAAVASDAHMHSYIPLQDVDSQPCCGVWQKLSSSLSAVWRWLCKCGGELMELGRKVRKKLMTALGFSQEEEVQQLLAVQQTKEREGLTVRAYRPKHHMEEPPGPSRLQRWRIS